MSELQNPSEQFKGQGRIMCKKHPNVPSTLICLDEKAEVKGLICGVCLSTDYIPYFKKTLPLGEFLKEITQNLYKLEDISEISSLNIYKALDRGFNDTLKILQQVQNEIYCLQQDLLAQYTEFKLFWQNKHPIVTGKALQKLQDLENIPKQDIKKYIKFLLDTCDVDQQSENVKIKLKQVDLEEFCSTYQNYMQTRNNKLSKINYNLNKTINSKIGVLEDLTQYYKSNCTNNQMKPQIDEEVFKGINNQGGLFQLQNNQPLISPIQPNQTIEQDESDFFISGYHQSPQKYQQNNILQINAFQITKNDINNQEKIKQRNLGQFGPPQQLIYSSILQPQQQKNVIIQPTQREGMIHRAIRPLNNRNY